MDILQAYFVGLALGAGLGGMAAALSSVHSTLAASLKDRINED